MMQLPQAAAQFLRTALGEPIFTKTPLNEVRWGTICALVISVCKRYSGRCILFVAAFDTDRVSSAQGNLEVT